MLSGYFFEFLWRRAYGDSFLTFLQHVAKVFNPSRARNNFAYNNTQNQPVYSDSESDDDDDDDDEPVILNGQEFDFDQMSDGEYALDENDDYEEGDDKEEVEEDSLL